MLTSDFYMLRQDHLVFGKFVNTKAYVIKILFDVKFFPKL